MYRQQHGRDHQKSCGYHAYAQFFPVWTETGNFAHPPFHVCEFPFPHIGNGGRCSPRSGTQQFEGFQQYHPIFMSRPSAALYAHPVADVLHICTEMFLENCQ